MDVSAYADELRTLADGLVEHETTAGDEAPAQDWLETGLGDLGFETDTWTADPERLASHSSFPDDPDEISTADRPSVAGVLELGDPDDGQTLVLNGHVDVVPVERDLWDTDPFEAVRRGEDLVGRGAADMKSGLAACVVAARALADEGGVDGRVVVESVSGEEDGGVGAAAAALDNPYPFERDAAIIAEPTELRPVVATEGSVMARLRLTGRSAHAATAWRGESVLPHFEHLRAGLEEWEAERHEGVTHPLYEAFPTRWPLVVGRLSAGSWASTVPAELTAELRVGVAPGETVDEVERELREQVAALSEEDDWLAEHPPDLERFSVQFEPAEIDPDEPVVVAVQAAMQASGLEDAAPRGATYGADQRHYVAAGIPTVLFGPGSIEQAHFPNERIHWPDVETAAGVLADAARTFLQGSEG
ncbi:peptidase M20 [Halobacteriales archaeon QS_1_68_20]|nr:MAG: peptidase M20 [Halobacteriales archaeon QS_1_68_20]